jgi:hypothetical protein
MCPALRCPLRTQLGAGFPGAFRGIQDSLEGGPAHLELSAED